jgi:hypothetical protein
MDKKPQYLIAIEEIEKEWIPALRNLLRWELLDEFKFTLWGLSGWHEDYDPYIVDEEATEEQKKEGWEMAIRMKKIMARVMYEEYDRLIQEIELYESEGPEVFYREKRE